VPDFRILLHSQRKPAESAFRVDVEHGDPPGSVTLSV